jgi:hypothetical protein
MASPRAHGTSRVPALEPLELAALPNWVILVAHDIAADLFKKLEREGKGEVKGATDVSTNPCATRCACATKESLQCQRQ